MSEKKDPSKDGILMVSFKKALGGGVGGMSAMAFQVGSMMWLRTALNYQYKTGTPFSMTMRLLYNEGGIGRFYRGVGPALIQAPLSRFGDTAANVGVIEFLDNTNSTKNLPMSVKTLCASTAAGIWRIFLMPVDTTKTMYQVHGSQGWSVLGEKIKSGGYRTLWHGSLGACGATIIGHFPWFYTYNTLNRVIPPVDKDQTLKKLGRYACIGFVSTLVSDTVSNAGRVVKTCKQTSANSDASYKQIVKDIVRNQGLGELFGRGLKTKIMINGVQGMVFTVVWNLVVDWMNN